jgi:hypothetical protein
MQPDWYTLPVQLPNHNGEEGKHLPVWLANQTGGMREGVCQSCCPTRLGEWGKYPPVWLGNQTGKAHQSGWTTRLARFKVSSASLVAQLYQDVFGSLVEQQDWRM